MALAFNCGFARMAIFTSYNPNDSQRIWLDKFNANFVEYPNLKCDNYLTFRRKAEVIRKTMNTKDFRQIKTFKNLEERNSFVAEFSIRSWEIEPNKEGHTLRECNVCRDKPIHGLFPTQLKRREIPHVVRARVNRARFGHNLRVNLPRCELKDVTKDLYEKCDRVIKRSFGEDMSFSDALCTVKELGLLKKLDPEQKTAKKRKKNLERKKGIRNKLKKSTDLINDSVLDATLASNESFSKYRLKRRMTYLIPKAEAVAKLEAKKRRIEENDLAPRTHCAKFGALEFDSDAMVEEALNEFVSKGILINCAAIGRKCAVRNITTDKAPTNISQTIKGIILHFGSERGITEESFRKCKINVRRSIKRISSEFSLYVPKTAEQAKEELILRVENGQIPIGEEFAPDVVIRTFMDKKTNKIRTER